MTERILVILAGCLLAYLAIVLLYRRARNHSELFCDKKGIDVSSIPPFDLLGVGAILLFLYLRFLPQQTANTPTPEQEIPLAQYILATISTILPAFCIYLFRLRQPQLESIPGWTLPKNISVFHTLLLYPLAVIVLTCLFNGRYRVSGLMEQIALWSNSPEKQNSVEILQSGAAPMGTKLFIAISAIIIAPVVEEIIFRGYIYPVLKKFGGMSVAVIFTSLLFGLVHLNIPAVLPLTVLSVLLILLYEKTKTLWAPIATHCLFNLLTVAASLSGLAS